MTGYLKSASRASYGRHLKTTSRCFEQAFGALLLSLLLVPGLAQARTYYTTDFQGAPPEVESELRRISLLVDLENHKPASSGALNDRARRDLDRLKTVMDSEGYYDAGLDFSVDMTGKRPHVVIIVSPGQRYVFGDAAIQSAPGSPPVPGGPIAYGYRRGAPAQAAKILSVEGNIIVHQQDTGFPFAHTLDRQVTADTATKTVTVIYRIDDGPRVHYGDTKIVGLKYLSSAYARRRVTWKAGDLYDQRQVDATRAALLRTNLFGSAAITATRPASANAASPIVIRLTERARHSVTAGAGYDTTEGIETTVGWENRNLFGGGEDLKLSATVGQSKNAAEVDYRIPDVGVIDRDFVSSVAVDNEIQNAFRTISESASEGFDWRLNANESTGASILAQHARVNEITDTRIYTLVGVPLTYKRDASDDPLNPSGGFRLNVTATPYARALGSDLTFLQALATTTFYHAMDPSKVYILAGQVTLGSTFGASLEAIPKDHRFYAGGGGSVRGFGFQKAGEIDQYGNPVGGRSLAEASLELRIRLSSVLGLVPFTDVGSDYPSSLPNFSRKPYLGAGIGLRYFTSIGPVRLDIATPINRHLPGDSAVQVYVSLGQAF